MSYDSEVLADTPAGYWKLDETGGTIAADSSGNGRNGTYQGGVNLGKSPIIRAVHAAAVMADGWDDLVSIPYNAALSTSPLSVECIIRPFCGGMTFRQYLFGSTESGGWVLFIDSSTLEIGWQAFIAGNYREVLWSPGVLADLPFHVVGVYTGRYLRLYVNGVKRAEYDHGSTVQITNTTVARMICANPKASGADAGYYYRGRIANVAYYNNALSDARIAAHYAATSRSVSFTVNESLAATQFLATARRAVDGVDVGSAVVATGAQTLAVDTYDPVMVTVAAYQGNCWKAFTSYALNDLVFPTNPTNTPYYYKRIAPGTSGASEPTWATTAGGQCNDGAVNNAWELVERLIQPITHGPLIPG
jgi:hypothetical protein